LTAIPCDTDATRNTDLFASPIAKIGRAQGA
jgi:hypothetical protein